MIDELGDRGQGEGVLDVDVVERHVLADHEGDGEVGGAPGSWEESPLLRAQPLGLAEDGEICKPQIHGSGETSQARRGWSVLTHLGHNFEARKRLIYKQFTAYTVENILSVPLPHMEFTRSKADIPVQGSAQWPRGLL